MLNRVTWAGLIAMAAAVLLYLGGLLTTFTRPMLPWIAGAGGLLFLGGITLAIMHRGQSDHTKTPSPE
jgi:hypothetical protein